MHAYADNVSIKDRGRCCGFTHPGGAVAEVISEIRPLGDPREALINQRRASREHLQTLLKSSSGRY